MATAFTALAVLLMLVAPACDGGVPSSERGRTISKEAFIETMVELRLGAAATEELRLTEAQRNRILTRMGVTADDLVRFAEVHGGNVPFMAEVWLEVEDRLRAIADVDEDGVREEDDDLVTPPVRGPGS